MRVGLRSRAVARCARDRRQRGGTMLGLMVIELQKLYCSPEERGSSPAAVPPARAGTCGRAPHVTLHLAQRAQAGTRPGVPVRCYSMGLHHQLDDDILLVQAAAGLNQGRAGVSAGVDACGSSSGDKASAWLVGTLAGQPIPFGYFSSPHILVCSAALWVGFHRHMESG